MNEAEINMVPFKIINNATVSWIEDLAVKKTNPPKTYARIPNIFIKTPLMSVKQLD